MNIPLPWIVNWEPIVVVRWYHHVGTRIYARCLIGTLGLRASALTPLKSPKRLSVDASLPIAVQLHHPTPS